MGSSDRPAAAAPRATGGAPPSEGRIRQVVVETKRQLASARDEVRAAHGRGLDPIRVCARLTTLVDNAVEALWRDALNGLTPDEAASATEGCALIAHGGYGRRQLAPHSDVDLMILHTPATAKLAGRLASRLTQDIFDVGLLLGHSLRTVDEALRMARTDAVVATSLVESRHLIGSQPLYERFFTAHRSALRRRAASASAEFVAARREERVKYGETVYLLEPNVKRSRGGLRDVHLLRWLWFVQTGASDLDRLRSMGVISKFDHHRLTSARNFLLRVRNELHFSATTGSDTLHRSEQLRIAERFDYQAGASLRPVELFMRDYFRHASHVWFMVNRMTELTAPRRSVTRVLEPVLGRLIERDYRVGVAEISATAMGIEKLTRRLEEALRLADLARLHDRRISQEAWYTIYRAAPDYDSHPSLDAADRFLGILANPSQLGPLLRRLHDLGVLEKIIPAMGVARCLLQFNQQHKFTVDEHCLRAVEMATHFADRPDALGEAYRKIEDKQTLHLALLLHDLGKGREEDHSVVGEEIAADTAERLRMSDNAAKRLRLLVRRHLDMAHLAFRRDTNDREVVDEFAGWIGDLETLRMLFVFTCADIAAVGPGLLNSWKVGVLEYLYRRAAERLQHGDERGDDPIQVARDAVRRLLRGDERDSDWFASRLDELPDWLLGPRSPRASAGALRRLKRLESGERGGVDAWGGYLQQGSTVEMLAAVANGSGKGVFSSMAGALSGKGLKILSAETTLLEGDLLLLRYAAEDSRVSSTTNAAEANRRIESIAAAMIASVGSSEPPRFPQIWGADRAASDAALAAPANEVRTDTATSAECAILEVFAIDRVGLLYELARALHEAGLVIRSAHISTSGDQVVDVFYVAERDGSKPADAQRLNEVSRVLMDVIEKCD